MEEFIVINEGLVNKILREKNDLIMQIVRETYLNFEAQNCINPDSFFLRFPDHDRNRIIGLAASNVRGENKVSGIKWIASYPDNVQLNLPRASASIILNDYMTGRALALVEGTAISAARTAASATLAAELLIEESTHPHTLSFIGCGVIARKVFDFLCDSHINLSKIFIYDLKPRAADIFKDMIIERDDRFEKNVIVMTSLDECIIKGDIVIFATTEIKPYISLANIQLDKLQSKVILGLSLRDLCPDIIMNANNIVDDIDHCLKANTSVHLTEQQVQHRQFINGTICELIKGVLTLQPTKPIIFSPFGMGVLDLNVAKYVYDYAKKNQLGLRCSFYEE